jgi:hypothetical protein
MTCLARFLVSGLLAFVLAVPAVAQQPDSAAAPAIQGQGKGVAALTNWPASLPELLREMGTDAPYLLPRLDSLALEYRYAADDSTSQWSFVLGWSPDHRVLYRGEILPREEGPSDVRMANVELRADVLVDGESVGDMIIAVDSMALRPLPSIYSFEVTVSHDRVFLDASAEEARRALVRGVTLDSLVVERMGFTSSEAQTSTSERRRPPDARERRPAPRLEPSVYESRTSIYIRWRVAPRPYYVDVDDKGDRRTVRPRGETVGQGADADDTRARASRRGNGDEDGDKTDRGWRGEADKKDDDDEEDDEPSLQGPALGAAAAIGLVAYAGGTVGLYGQEDTPIGLAAGYTQPSGGVQLQAAVNGAVLEDEPGQKLTLKALGFYDVFSSRVQPAVGLGVQIDPQREGDVAPSASVGLAGNFGRVVLLGGVDVVQGTPEIGLTYNFRYDAPGEKDASSP